MKYFFPFFVCFIIWGFSSFAQTNTANQVDELGRKQGFWRKEVGGRPIYEGNFKDDRPVGKMKRFRANGQLQTLMFYQENSDTVFIKRYGKRNKVVFEGTYVGKKKTGLWYFYSDGRLILSENYMNDLKEGKSELFDVDQNLKTEMSWQNDTLNGPMQEYYANGILKWKVLYRSGKRNGTYQSFHKNSNLQTKGMYVDDYKDGSWLYLNLKGDTLLVEEFDKGKVLQSKAFFKEDNLDIETIKKNAAQFKNPMDYIKDPAAYFLKR